MAAMVLFDESGSADFNQAGFFFFLSLAISIVAFLFGPVVLPWITYVAVDNVFFGLSEDHMYFLCCTTKNRAEQFLGEVGLVVSFPPALMCSIALASMLVRRRLSTTYVALIVVAGIAVSHLTLKYYHYLDVQVDCSKLQCNF